MAAKVRKQFLLDLDLLRRAKNALGAKTDTEAVTRALEEAAINAEIAAAHEEWVKGKGEIRDVYGVLAN
jgi:hypothetical protein